MIQKLGERNSIYSKLWMTHPISWSVEATLVRLNYSTSFEYLMMNRTVCGAQALGRATISSLLISYNVTAGPNASALLVQTSNLMLRKIISRARDEFPPRWLGFRNQTPVWLPL